MTLKAEFNLRCDNGTLPLLRLANESASVRMEHSDWTTTDLGNGFVMESFTLFYNVTSTSITSNIKLIGNYLELAHNIHAGKTPFERVRLATRVTDEDDVRVSTVIGGTITPVPDRVLVRGHKRDAAKYAVTIERHRHWEYGTELGWTESGLSDHGGTATVPLQYATGIQPGRIKTTQIVPYQEHRFNKVWLGIKPAYTDLTNFNPEIEINDNQSFTMTDGISRIAPDDDSERGFLDDEGVIVYWGDTTAWSQILKINLSSFNTETATATNRPAYHGKYHLLMRYKTTADAATYGIRAAYGWWETPDATELDSKYLESTSDNFHYVDLGVVSIGGDGFTHEMVNRAQLRQFTISLHGTVIDGAEDGNGNNASFLYVDNMFLVPAEHFLYFELPFTLGWKNSDKRAEIYIDEGGAASGLVVSKENDDKIIEDLQRIIHERIVTIDADSWSMPTQENSKLVIVTDTADNETALGVSSKVNMATSVVNRTVNL